MKRALLAGLICLAWFAAPAHAVPQGFYDVCATSCEARWQKTHDAGFDIIATWPSQQAADDAAAAGLGVIWELGGGGGDVSWLKDLPITRGYILWDEPVVAEHDAVKALADNVASQDPNHPRYVNVCNCSRPGDPPDSALYDAWSDVDATLTNDPFPVANQDPNPQRVYDAVRGVDHRFGGLVLQAWRMGDSWYDGGQTWDFPSRFPTHDEVRAMRDAAVDNGAGVILWFMLPDTLGWAEGTQQWFWAVVTDGDARWEAMLGAVSGTSTAVASPVASAAGSTPSEPSSEPSSPQSSSPPTVATPDPAPNCHTRARGALPDPECSPGTVQSHDRKAICTPGWSSRHRLVTSATKRLVYANYGLTGPHPFPAWEVDHRVPLELGGSNRISNLWPQHFPKLKDKLENRLHKMVCSGRMKLARAVHVFKSDWRKHL